MTHKNGEALNLSPDLSTEKFDAFWIVFSSGSVLSFLREYRSGKTPYLDTFYTVIIIRF